MELDIYERYKNKICTVSELLLQIGSFPRQSKVVMCHGVFDVVHPGHIRHFLFAKNKAPILVASLTADRHIQKGEGRPHVPEKLRAINLAALEFVDYVIIDDNELPIENLSIIKPDLFVKGYEYSPVQLNTKKTSEEIQLVQSYGGQVIFSPGDFILSSSSIINKTPPNIKVDKLLLLMNRANIKFSDLINATQSLSNQKVHVVGDLIIDSYTYCSVIGGQIKTPTISLKFESRLDLVGGAGIVAKHLKSAGADVELTTVVGDDALGEFAKSDLTNHGVKFFGYVDKNRPTTNKNVFIADGYRLLKVDDLDNTSITDDQASEITSRISHTDAEVVIFSDFRHGIFNKRTIPSMVGSIPRNILKVADSQVASRWGNILEFNDFDLITPNEKEARFSLADQDSGIRALASNLYRESKCKTLILKLGSRGILTTTSSDSQTLDDYFVMDSFVDNLIDPVGAGDALLAYATLVLAKTGNVVLASIIGNLAAACECEKEGNEPIIPRDIIDKILSIERQVDLKVN